MDNPCIFDLHKRLLRKEDMGVAYSHLTKEEMERNRKLNEGRGARKVEGTTTIFPLEKAKEEVDDWLRKEAKKWCSCNLGQEGYDFHVSPNKHCGICKEEIDNDHYHCGACLKLSQIG